MDSEKLDQDYKDPFYNYQEKLYAWIAFVKFYFFDTSDVFDKITEGTGFLNSNWTMITARHNLYLPKENKKCSHCVIQLRDPNNKNQKIQIRSQPVEQRFENVELDIALVRLTVEVKNFREGVFFNSPLDIQQLQQSDQMLFLAGFSNEMKAPIDKANDLIVVRPNLRGIEKNTIRYGGRTDKGLSGSPLIYRMGKEEIKLKVVGMHLSRTLETEDRQGLHFSSGVLDLIQQWTGICYLQKIQMVTKLQIQMIDHVKMLEQLRNSLEHNVNGMGGLSKLNMLKRQEDSQQKEIRVGNKLAMLIHKAKDVSKIYEILANFVINNYMSKKSISDIIPYDFNPEDQQPQKLFQNIQSEIARHCKDRKYSSVISNDQGKFQLVTNAIEVHLKPQWTKGRQCSSCLKSLQNMQELSEQFVNTSNISIISSYNKCEYSIQQSLNCVQDELAELFSQESTLARMNHIQKARQRAFFQFPDNCIGHIRCINSSGIQQTVGSGFLISSNLVLTTAHIVKNKLKSDRKFQQMDFTFIDQVEDQFVQKKNKVVNHKFHPQFIRCFDLWTDVMKQNNSENGDKQKRIKEIEQQLFKYNYSLLRLQEPIKRSQYSELTRDIHLLPELMVCGFTQGAQILQSGSTVYRENNILFYEMGIKMEYSGSPVFFKDEGKLSLLGIHQLAEKENSFNMATMVTNEMIDAVQKWAKKMDSSIKVSTFKDKLASKQDQINQLNQQMQQTIKQNASLKKDNKLSKGINKMHKNDILQLKLQIFGLKEINQRLQCRLKRQDKELQPFRVANNQPKNITE